MGEMNFTFEDIFGSKGKMLDEMTQENQPSISKKSSENSKRLQEDSRNIIQFINSDVQANYTIELERSKLSRLMSSSIQAVESMTDSLCSAILQLDPSKETSINFINQIITVTDNYEKQYVDLLARIGLELAKAADSIQKNETLIMSNPAGLGELISYFGQCMEMYKHIKNSIINSLDAVRGQDNGNRFAIAIADRLSEISEQIEENEKNDEQSTDQN